MKKGEGKNNLGRLPVIQSLSLLAGVQAGVIGKKHPFSDQRHKNVNSREQRNVKFDVRHF